MKRVTLKDIANEIGVHVSTVSLALKKNPRIPEETQKLIRDKAEEMGYVPDPQMSALVHYRNKNREKRFHEKIAFLTHWPLDIDWQKIYAHRLFYEGAVKVAESLGYALEIFSLREEGMTAQRMSQILKSRGIRGIILSSIYRDIDNIEMDWSSFCTVRIDLGPKQVPIHTVRNDQVQGIRMAVKKLKELGYDSRRIGFCVPRGIEQGIDYNWGMGFSWEVRDWKKTVDEPLLYLEYSNLEEKFIEWFLKNRPEVILAESSKYGEILLEKGYRLPIDVSYVNLNHDGDERFSGVQQNHKAVGEAACSYLHSLLIQNETGLPETPYTLLVPGKWIEGKSLIASNLTYE